MKILYINGYFKLSDNFQGFLADGLIELGNYLKMAKQTDGEPSKEIIEATNISNAKTYPVFIEAVNKRNKRFYGVHALGIVDDNGYATQDRVDKF